MKAPQDPVAENVIPSSFFSPSNINNHIDFRCAFFNCLFCFCPLYRLGERCGGNPTFIEGADGARVKDCSACTLPHRRENYGYIMERLSS